jgi:hypothetical protein
MQKNISVKSILLICAFGLLIILITYNLITGITIKKIGMPGIFEIEFESPAGPQNCIGGNAITEDLSTYDVPLTTLVGQGVINGLTINLSYNTFLNTWGNATIDVSADGRTLYGKFYDSVA